MQRTLRPSRLDVNVQYKEKRCDKCIADRMHLATKPSSLGDLQQNHGLACFCHKFLHY